MNQTQTGLTILATLSVLSCGPQQSESNTTTVELPPASATMSVDTSSEFKTGTPADAVGKGWLYRTEYGQDGRNTYTASLAGLATASPNAPVYEARTVTLTLRKESILTSLTLSINQGAPFISDVDLGEIRVQFNDGSFTPYVTQPDLDARKEQVSIIGGNGFVQRLKTSDKVRIRIPLTGEGTWLAEFDAPALKWDH